MKNCPDCESRLTDGQRVRFVQDDPDGYGFVLCEDCYEAAVQAQMEYDEQAIEGKRS
jgi:hypothetical protein